MHEEVDRLIQFIIDALTANAAKEKGSVVTIKILPFAKNSREKKTRTAVTPDDVIDAHEALATFDGDFRSLFDTRSTKPNKRNQ